MEIQTKEDNESYRYMILVDELPLRTVEKLSFKYLISIVCPMFKMSSRMAITRVYI